MRPKRIPLFPLNVVLLPGTDLPLHIFEPRYRGMVHECLKSKSPFGMLLALEDGVVRVGCSAEIVEVVKTYADGRMDIVSVGREPFRVLELFHDDPLLQGDVDYLEDRVTPLNAELRRRLVELYEACHTLVFGDYPRNLNEQSLEHLSYLVVGSLPMDLLWKQQILELRTESERQERLLTYLREWAPHLQKLKSFHQTAGGNGRGLN
jgi:ATP-dependent Lon protease